jgi:hypothetical protein
MKKHHAMAIAVLVAGCASQPKPTDTLASSVNAAHRAEEAGAQRIPDAELHLRLANQQNNEAKHMMDEGENERAALLSRRAQSDAELSLALAREHDANQRVAQVSTIQQQLDTAQTQPQSSTP